MTLTNGRTRTNVLDIYGSFLLNGTEFALTAQNIHEVVHAPEKYTPMPLAPDYLLGVFNLRGVIIPAIDLKKLLRLKTDGPASARRKIAIIEHEGIRVGLCFDDTGEILRSRPEERSEFADAKVVTGALKLDGGKRIIQILCPRDLVHLEHVPRTMTSVAQVKAARGQRRQCISFSVNQAKCAFGIDAFQEIIRVPELKESAFQGKLCVGLLELRSEIIPVLDFAVILGYRNEAEHGVADDRRIIIMKMGDEKFGLLIDSVESIITYYDDDLLGLPVLGKENPQLFLGCISREGYPDVIVLDAEQVLTNAEVMELTHGHSKVYRASETGAAALLKSRSPRRTYVAFQLESVIAVGIQEILEIIEAPSELLKPPGLPAHIQGMLNLRGQIIAIVDARTLYAMPARNSETRGKVLIFEREGVKYGLVVDSVENILSFSDDEKLQLPESLFPTGGGNLAQDIREVVQIKHGDATKTLMILDLAPLAQRVGLSAAS